MNWKRDLCLASWLIVCLAASGGRVVGQESAITRHWLWSKAYVIPEETTSEQSGYFSIVEGHDGHICLASIRSAEGASIRWAELFEGLASVVSVRSDN